MSGNHELGYELAFRHFTPVDPKQITREQLYSTGYSLKSSIKHSFIRDTRDNPFYPSSGSFFNLSHEFAGLGGDVKFLKQMISANHHIPLSLPSPLPRVIVSFDATAGNLVGLFGYQSTIPDRFFLGKYLAPFRGFMAKEVGPHDGFEHVGGDMMFSARSHVTFPIFPSSWGTISDILMMHGFISAGNLIARNQAGTFFSNLKALGSDVRMVAGLGFVLKTPLGRVEINANYPLRHKERDTIQTTQFVIGFSY